MLAGVRSKAARKRILQPRAVRLRSISSPQGKLARDVGSSSTSQVANKFASKVPLLLAAGGRAGNSLGCAFAPPTSCIPKFQGWCGQRVAYRQSRERESETLDALFPQAIQGQTPGPFPAGQRHGDATCHARRECSQSWPVPLHSHVRQNRGAIYRERRRRLRTALGATHAHDATPAAFRTSSRFAPVGCALPG